MTRSKPVQLYLFPTPPAGILQPPRFDPSADDAANYGAIGGTIGGTIGHD